MWRLQSISLQLSSNLKLVTLSTCQHMQQGQTRFACIIKCRPLVFAAFNSKCCLQDIKVASPSVSA